MTKCMEDGIKGLCDREVEASRSQYGSNTLVRKKKKSIGGMVLENLSDPIIRILIGALIINTIVTYRHINWAETIGILAAIVIATLVSVISQRGGERAFEKMNEMAGAQKVSVIRNGCWQHIMGQELVVGDFVRVGSGERIPADGRMVSGELELDQSTLNGESKPAQKRVGSEGDGSASDESMLLCGSMVLKGSAIFCVTKVGGDTVYGAIAGELQSEERASPMQRRLTHLAEVISRIGYVAAAVVALTYLLNTIVLDSASKAEIIYKVRDLSFMFSSFVKALTIGITVIVVAVPEGLPMMLTVVLSANMRRMYRDKVLVRKPIGIETAGNMNILFCDKTGTLTTGNLTMETLYLGNLHPFHSSLALRQYPAILPYFMLQAYYNTEAIWEGNAPQGGNATERALLAFAGRGKPMGITVVSRIPFDSRYKYSAVSLSGLQHPLSLYKGAPEVLLPHCNTYLDQEGNIQILENKEVVYKKISEIAGALGRVILLCQSQSKIKEDRIPENMTLVGMVCLRDEIRKGVPKALSEMTLAGVQTVMVTGDSRETAYSIAKRCGMLGNISDEDGVITSAEMEKLSDTELALRLPKLRVVARAMPKDKSRLVRVAQNCDLVVGMTGDGVNDAPALKMADVGFAMGSGTDVAREAADVVILDCNFLSIVRAVLYGRTIFHSVQKFIVFQLTMNLCAVGISLFGQMVGIETPVTVIQMLWVNIIMDTLGGLAFAGEAPSSAYMKEEPKWRDEPILNRKMIVKTLIMGIYTVFLSTLFLFSDRMRMMYCYKSDPTRLLTAFFALFIFCGIWICFTARSDGRGLFSRISQNKVFIVIMATIVCVQLLILNFGGATFRCVPLSVKELLTVVLLSSTILPVDFIRRFFVLLSK